MPLASPPMAIPLHAIPSAQPAALRPLRRGLPAGRGTGFCASIGPGDPQADQYLRARRAFEEESAAYWRSVADKRRIRNAKRRDKEPILLSDYVLEQPPVYSGPPRPPGPAVPAEPRKPEMPVVADFLEAAAEEFGFVPRRPKNELEFKRAYARAALEGGLTKEQALGVYAFETGGNGSYDTQAGLTGSGHARDLAGARLQPAPQHQQCRTARGIRRPPHRDAHARGRAALRPGEAGDAAKDRRATSHDRFQPDGAVPVERARPARQDDARRTRHSCGGARSRHRTVAADPEARELGASMRAAGATGGCLPLPSSS